MPLLHFQRECGMDTDLILTLLKEKLDIRHGKRDNYLLNIIKGIIKELEDEKGITLEPGNLNHTLFVMDYAEHRVNDPKADMPRNLRFRLNNLVIHNGGGKDENGSD